MKHSLDFTGFWVSAEKVVKKCQTEDEEARIAANEAKIAAEKTSGAIISVEGKEREEMDCIWALEAKIDESPLFKLRKMAWNEKIKYADCQRKMDEESAIVIHGNIIS